MAGLLPSQQKAQPQMRRTMASTRGNKLGRMSVVQAGVLCACTAVVSFYFGMILGSSAASHCTSNVADSNAANCLTEDQVQERVQRELNKSSSSQVKAQGSGRGGAENRFPRGMQHLVSGMAQVDRDDFAKRFDLGVPLDPSDSMNNKILMLYNTPSAIPPEVMNEAAGQAPLPLLSAENATSHCDFFHVVLQDHGGKRRQCTAIFGQYEAFHIQKYMRLPEHKAPLDPKLPLRIVNRGAQSSGRKSTAAPSLETTKNYWKTLQSYLGRIDEVVAKLKPLVEKIAVQNTVIVQVCNFGQSELLINFLCSARQRSLDTSAVLVFATDQETYDLVNAIGGATVFYDQELFGDMPTKAAGRYGDPTFMRMMMAKIYCVQLINMLGYDILFQDVDVVWYQNPLAYFHNKDADDADFDVYFQDDGNHALFYAPYSANTGFYYVRANEKTQYFFNSFLMAGDLVIETRSHQIPLVALLQEHSSMYGLRIKIFSRDGDIFPGGHAYHRRKSLMQDLFAGKSQAQIFHMSWTNSKTNKVKFFQQMGEYFLQDQCREKSVADIWGQETPGDLAAKCCSEEPKIVCHFRDKPSKIPCKESPPIDKGGKSFW